MAEPTDILKQRVRVLEAEIGTTGLPTWGGVVADEFLRQLQGQSGIKLYREMRDNDAMIGSLLTLIDLMVRQAEPWSFKPADASQAAGRARDLAQISLDQMSFTWRDTLSEILSFLVYGWSFFEICYKKRADGFIGWKKFAIRGQDTLSEWKFDEEGGIRAMVQVAAPDYKQVTLPIEKCLLFRTRLERNNPQGRALALDVPILTTTGWKTMRTVSIGDRVFDEQGKTRYVTAKSETWTNRECYEIRFNSGEQIVADAEHLWRATTANDRYHGTKRRVRLWTTREMYERFRKNRETVFSVGNPVVVDQPKQWLPLDPYLLGYWLGDGSRGAAEISVSKQDWPALKEHVEKAGFEIALHRHGSHLGEKAYIKGLRPWLRWIGVLQDKHVPDAYLRGDYEQRLALLQGLMDSDGSSPMGRKPSYFCNTNLRLVEAVQELVSSLGAVPMTTSCDPSARVGNEINGHLIKSKKRSYRVVFWAPFPAHRLKRKLANQSFDNTSSRMKSFYIREIVPVGKRATVCIEVDSPNHLFLCGKTLIPTHNSILRPAFRTFYFKRRIEEIEGIGIERDLAGIPVLTPPEGLDLWNTHDSDAVSKRAEAEKVVRNLRRDQHEGIVKPFGWELSLLSTGGRRQFDITATLNRMDARIAMTSLAEFLLLGTQNVGSFALASSKTHLFSVATGSYLDIIADVINRHAVPRLMEVNSIPVELSPTLTHGDIETVDMADLAEVLFKLAGAGMPVFPSPELHKHLFQLMGLPEPTETEEG